MNSIPDFSWYSMKDAGVEKQVCIDKISSTISAHSAHYGLVLNNLAR